MSRKDKKRAILIIDDDVLFCDATKEYLKRPELHVEAVHTASAGLSSCHNGRYDVILLDQNLPDGDGQVLCPKLLEINEQSKIIFITAHPSFDSAVTALRAGAHDYLSKPFDPEELVLALDQALRTLSLEDVEHLARYQRQKERMQTVLVGSAGGLAEAARLVTLAGSAEAPVLITGETGTGKNVAAKAIHFASDRRDRPFISVNCAALPENLIEAELFGHEKGAYTGATSMRRGVFEIASGGTLFLDEIGEMPLHLQAKLLGVLEDDEIRRLGGERSRSVDVHVIAATAADLEEALDSTFRRDLYFRLSVMRIHMPPLRERPQDIATLCEHFLTELRGSAAPSISQSEYDRLQTYKWPGNVRELRNILERATIVQPGPQIEPSQLLGSTIATTALSPVAPKHSGATVKSLEEIERDHIRFALDTLDHNYTRTAEILGIAISTLKRKIRKYGLSRP